MKPMFTRVYQFYGRLLVVIAVVAGFAMFAMMWLVGLNSLTRKVFNAPIVGTVEITEALMTFAVMLPMAYTQFKRSHIRVTLLVSRLPPAVAHVLYAMTLLIGCLFFAWATWATFGFALRSYQIHEQAWGTIRFPIWPAKGAVAFGAALLSIQLLLDFLRVSVFHIIDEADEVSHDPEAEVAEGKVPSHG